MGKLALKMLQNTKIFGSPKKRGKPENNKEMGPEKAGKNNKEKKQGNPKSGERSLRVGVCR